MNKIVLRIEEDKSITKLLKRHYKYIEEYYFNVNEQGYYHLILEKLSPIIISCAIASVVLDVVNTNLKDKEVTSNEN